MTTSFSQSPRWQDLLAHRETLAGLGPAALWARDPRRGDAFTVHCAGLAVDLSRQRLTTQTLALLCALARERGLPEAIDALFAGEAVNTTENRAALHTALRGDEHVLTGGRDVLPGIQRARDRLRVFAEAVREGRWKGATGLALRQVLVLGIGGSLAGPRLVIDALREPGSPEVRFAANLDPAELDAALQGLDPASTLLVIASKTFTTEETMANARAARAWLVASLGENALERHAVAATARPAEAIAWGLPECNVFAFDDWVGGRFSLWSSVGMPIAICLGMAGFERLLAGAHAVDLEFRSSPLEFNAPALLALGDVWNVNALGATSHVILPYAARLAGMPDYVQQLGMESNGKRVDRAGVAVDFATAPAIWGAAGTNAQHAFAQWLHQGTSTAFCDFIVVARPMGSRDDAHARLLSHACAQAEALANGLASPEAWRSCPGGVTSTTIVMPALDAFHLGALLALYEHRIAAQAALWGINGFDQWGVELGKSIAGRLLPAVQGSQDAADPATRHLIALIHKLAQSG